MIADDAVRRWTRLGEQPARQRSVLPALPSKRPTVPNPAAIPVVMDPKVAVGPHHSSIPNFPTGFLWSESQLRAPLACSLLLSL